MLAELHSAGFAFWIVSRSYVLFQLLTLLLGDWILFRVSFRWLPHSLLAGTHLGYGEAKGLHLQHFVRVCFASIIRWAMLPEENNFTCKLHLLAGAYIQTYVKGDLDLFGAFSCCGLPSYWAEKCSGNWWLNMGLMKVRAVDGIGPKKLSGIGMIFEHHNRNFSTFRPWVDTF